MLDVRPLEDLAEWPGLSALAAADPAGWSGVLPSDAPLSTWLVLEHGAPLALLYGTVIEAGYRILDAIGPPGAIERALPFFLHFLLLRFPGQRIEARISDVPQKNALHRQLLEAGAQQVLEQVLYACDLVSPSAPETDQASDGDSAQQVELRPYADVGKARVLDLLRLIFNGDGDGTGRMTADPVRELDQMLFEATAAGGSLDLWWVVQRGGEPVGVALAQGTVAEDAPTPGTGWLQFFGLLPELRGQGLGQRTHRQVLRRMVQVGLRRYEDATTCGNTAMRRVFERNGCAEVGRARAYVLCWERDTGHLSDFPALLSYLESERYRIERSDEQPVWVRTPMRFGRDEAMVHLCWNEDARLLQVLHQFPFHVAPDGVARAVQAAADLNASLAVPGFMLNSRTGRVDFRLPILLNQRGGVAVHHLRRALATVVHAAARYGPWWQELLGEAGHRPLDGKSLHEVFAHLV
jgi:RimJ/RimL family protein N-acetyltransferase